MKICIRDQSFHVEKQSLEIFRYGTTRAELSFFNRAIKNLAVLSLQAAFL